MNDTSTSRWTRGFRFFSSVAAGLAVVALAVGSVAAGTGSGATKSAAPASKGEAQGEKININTASQEQLETLPGIGPALAQKILDYRKQNGAFKKVEELMNVKGIGEKSFERMKSRLTVGQ